jgi:hypothetical protein
VYQPSSHTPIKQKTAKRMTPLPRNLARLFGRRRSCLRVFRPPLAVPLFYIDTQKAPQIPTILDSQIDGSTLCAYVFQIAKIPPWLCGYCGFELGGKVGTALGLAFGLRKRVTLMCSRIFASRFRVRDISSLSFRNRMVRSRSLSSSAPSTREDSSELYVPAKTSILPNWLATRVSWPQ